MMYFKIGVWIIALCSIRMVCAGTGSFSESQVAELEDAYETFRKGSLARLVYPARKDAGIARRAGDAVRLNAAIAREISEYEKHREELTDFALSTLLGTPALAVSASRWGDYRLDELSEAVESFEVLFPGHEDIEGLKARISTLRRVSIGAQAPEISGKSPEGASVSLSDFKGKYVLLDFWAGWCPPCRVENTHYASLYSKYGGEQFEILAVSQDHRFDQWKRAILQDKAIWKHMSDVQGFKGSQAKTYGVTALPENFLINPEGIIIAKGLRREALELKLKELLN